MYRLRTFREEDADALAALAVRSIERIGPRAYSPQQVAAWRARHGNAARYVERAGGGDTILVTVDQAGRACAYVLLAAPSDSGSHLDHLYCDPDHTRRGLAERLLAEAERLARAAYSARIFTEASELARPAFERAGYRVTHRRDFTIAHAGEDVPIHNYAMEKLLA